MKTIAMAGLLGLLTIFPASAQKLTERERELFKGLVKSVRLEAIFKSTSRGKTARQILTETFYKPTGELAEIVEYSRNQIFSRTLCNYIAEGKQLRKKYYAAERISAGRGATKGVPGGRGDGLLYRPPPPIIRSRDGAILQLYVYQYDEKGNVTEESIYQGETVLTQNLFRKTVYKYDSKGLLIEEATYDYTGTQVSRQVIILDEHGDPVETDSYEGGSSKADKSTYTFEVDSKNGLRKMTTKTDSFNTETIFDLYDKQGNWIKQSQKKRYISPWKQNENEELFGFRVIKYYQPEGRERIDSKP
jgi:hypothetical protein